MRRVSLAGVRVRGIYATALTRVLLDHGFEIVQPSLTTRERFRLEDREEPPDLDVYDRPDRQGVYALGRAEALEAFVSLLKSLLLDVVIRRWRVVPDGVYKGVVRRRDRATRSVMVDIGPAVGRVPAEELPGSGAEQILVQVDRRVGETGEPALTTRITVPGRYAVLIPGRQVKISLKIRDPPTRARLKRLGEELAPQGWGVLWRTAAAAQEPDTLREEVERLAREGAALAERAGRVEAPAAIWGESRFADVEFPAVSKRTLDEVRRAVAPTIEGHHNYKACSGKISAALEMAEGMLEKGAAEEEVRGLLLQTVEAEYPGVGSLIEVEHVKLDGRVFHLGLARVEAFDGDPPLLRLRRIFEGRGTYDGLGTPKEPGDYAVTEVRVGGWHYRTRYFSADGRYKGMYVNVNTPVELYSRGIRYVDLEVDLCVWPDGRVKRLEEERLEEAVAGGVITERLGETVRKQTRGLMRTLRREGE